MKTSQPIDHCDFHRSYSRYCEACEEARKKYAVEHPFDPLPASSETRGCQLRTPLRDKGKELLDVIKTAREKFDLAHKLETNLAREAMLRACLGDVLLALELQHGLR